MIFTDPFDFMFTSKNEKPLANKYHFRYNFIEVRTKNIKK